MWHASHHTKVMLGPFQGKEITAGQLTHTENHSFLVKSRVEVNSSLGLFTRFWNEL